MGLTLIVDVNCVPSYYVEGRRVTAVDQTACTSNWAYKDGSKLVRPEYPSP
jgi:hypothetical protein